MSRKIDLMIIGAQKAGTTALKNYLNEHPDILGHPQTEFTYFNDESEYNKGFDNAFSKYFSEGDPVKSKLVLAKYVSIYYEEKLLERLAKHNAECKLIFIIREPVARAYSSFSMEQYRGNSKRDSLEMITAIEEKNYDDSMYRIFIKLGLYDEHLTTIYKYFPKNQVKIILFEDLNNNTLGTCQEIFQWMKVDDKFIPNTKVKHNETRVAKSQLLGKIIVKLKNNQNIVKRITKKVLPYSLFTKLGNSLVKYNKSNNKFQPISPKLKSYLQDFFRPHIQNLEQMTGLDLKHWYKQFQ